MKAIALEEGLFGGAVSVEKIGEAFKPWRLPYKDLALFPPDGIGGQAERAAGVRVQGWSDAGSVRLELEPADIERQVDCVLDGELHASGVVLAGARSVAFDGLQRVGKRIELYLDHRHPATVTGLYVEDGASWERPAAARPQWITYGSSITHGAEADSPSRTWPALAARRGGLDLTCLGYSGNCLLEPMVARFIRDIPAAYLSCCFGINVYGQASHTKRTFLPAVIGFIQTLRERHSETPLAIVSPLYCPDRESAENRAGLTLRSIRDDVAEAVALLKQRGDRAIQYVDGLQLLGEEDAHLLHDRLHPNAEGYRRIADRFYQAAVEGWLKKASE